MTRDVDSVEVRGLIHIENPKDDESALCGEVISRRHAVSTRQDYSNVDCLACLMEAQKRGIIK